MKSYDHRTIEKRWQARWKKSGIYTTKERYGKPKCYVLDMFPYPSGEGLHVGHPKGYIATDIYSRFKRMQGYSVLHPMGFDAFGLPAENYALKTKTHPEVAVKTNVKRFKKQLELIGLDYDWSREITTTDPEYYQWTQWIFLQMYKDGLAYESHEPINWCPSCKTGLANEDVEDGKCERCGTVVEKKPMRQWVLKITEYADKLLSGLNDLDWPESIKELQRNWIGKSEGSELDFKIAETNESIKVFTTRADTLFGATYVVLAPEHSLVDTLKNHITNWAEIERYREESGKKADIERTAEGKEKTGVELKGIKAVNPANQEELPIFIADYVLSGYGTGAIMAVPAHDERDFAFAKKFNLPVREVILPVEGTPHEGAEFRKTISAIVQRKSDKKFLALAWKKFGWISVPIGGIEGDESPEVTAEREVLEETGYTAKAVSLLGGQIESHFFAENKNIWRSRLDQPVFLEVESEERKEVSHEETEKHTATWITGEELLKKITHKYNAFGLERFLRGNMVFTGVGKVINSSQFTGLTNEEAKKKITDFVGGKFVTRYKLRDWVFSRQRYWGEPIPLIHCPNCGVVPVPEKELPVKLPKVAHYEPTGTGESPLAGIEKWVRVKCPTCKGEGRRETNTMPQWAGSSWYWLRYMDPKNKKRFVDAKKETYWSPVDFYVGGAEHATRHLIYARFWHKFLFDKGYVSKPEPFAKLQHVGLIMGEDGRKMSKRWGNIVNPDEVIERFGADALRVYEMFMGPFDQAIAWNTDNLVGAKRFLERVWGLRDVVNHEKDFKDGHEVITLLHQTIRKVTDDITAFKFNTAISQLMILTGAFERASSVSHASYGTFVSLLSVFAPHLAEELWAYLGNKKSVHASTWPLYDKELVERAEITIAVQVNGKVRGSIQVSRETEEGEALEKAMALPEIVKWTEGKTPRKVVYVKAKILNLVL